MIRLNKYLAAAGIASRRKCDDYIAAGRVRVNGQVVTEMGIRIDEEKDRIEFDGKPVSPSEKQVYIMLNKPYGIMTTAEDQFGRPTVLDLIPVDERIYPVGRLDYDSTGLLLLTNDGELTNALLHPRYKVEKIYQVLLDGLLSQVSRHRLEQGIMLDGRKTARCKIEEIRAIDNCSLLQMTISEGRNRQIRRMFAEEGYTVERLERISFGPLQLTGLKTGEWRYLTEREISRLKKYVNYAELQAL